MLTGKVTSFKANFNKRTTTEVFEVTLRLEIDATALLKYLYLQKLFE